MGSIRNNGQVLYKLFWFAWGKEDGFLSKKEMQFNFNWNCEIAYIWDV